MKGHLVNVENLFNLSNDCNPSGEEKFLKGNRIYNIPKYQREIRWEEKQINELLDDLSNGNKYLGQVVFKENNNSNVYDIIDGQQRITSINIIMRIMKESVSGAIPEEYFPFLIDDELKNHSIEGVFSFLFEEEEVVSDIYNQKERFNNLKDKVISYFEDKSTDQKRNLIDNLLNSKFSVILVEDDTSGDGAVKNIELLFLDINDKGKKLDVEDLYKAYLFSMNRSNNNIQSSWIELKQEYENSDIKKMKYLNKLSDYIYYYYLTEYELDKNLIEEGSKKHIVQKINNANDLLIHTQKMKQLIEIFNSEKIIQKYFSVEDDTVKIVIKEQIDIILKQNNVIPKVFLLRILKEDLLEDSRTQKRVKLNIWFVYSIFFIVWKGKKDLGAEKIREDNLFEVLKRHIPKILEESNNKISNFQSFTLSEEEKSQHIFKALEYIYNFIGNNYKINNYQNFLEFKQRCTVEHIINGNNSCTYINSNDEIENYGSEYKKYVKKNNNLILIDRQFNIDILKDYHIYHKKELITQMLSENNIIPDYDHYFRFWYKHGILNVIEDNLDENFDSFNNELKKEFLGKYETN